MQYDSFKHHRRSIRLKGFDYSSPGAYFVTIRTQKRSCFFGETLNGEMHLNAAGLMVGRVWNELQGRFTNVLSIIQSLYESIKISGIRVSSYLTQVP